MLIFISDFWTKFFSANGEEFQKLMKISYFSPNKPNRSPGDIYQFDR